MHSNQQVKLFRIGIFECLITVHSGIAKQHVGKQNVLPLEAVHQPRMVVSAKVHLQALS